MKPKAAAGGSGTTVAPEDETSKVPDCKLVMLVPELMSAAEHALPFDTKSGQKYSWIFWGVGVEPFGRGVVRNSEKRPL
jgi:hypothetical protein